MIYKPQIQFERARMQSGFFIAQAFMDFTETLYDAYILAHQRIYFNQRIKIQNPETVLQELENIGVNRATIFGDFDSVAKHIVKKHRR